MPSENKSNNKTDSKKTITWYVMMYYHDYVDGDCNLFYTDQLLMIMTDCDDYMKAWRDKINLDDIGNVHHQGCMTLEYIRDSEVSMPGR